MTTLTHLECACCGLRYDAGSVQTVCRCGGPLLARYDLERARQSWSREWIKSGPPSIWRYAPVLPVSRPGSIVSLGEGMTPLVRARRWCERVGAQQVWIKDEGLNPTGSVKARDMACAVSMLRELGLPRAALASLGNAAAALGAYAAAADIEARAFLPRRSSALVLQECRAYGLHATTMGGDLADCARKLAESNADDRFFNLSAWREPYRLEGRKTLAYELAEDFSWSAPDVIVCPAAEGLGLIAVMKAFEEMEALGWVSGARPMLVAVQAEACAPLVEALAQAREIEPPCDDPITVAGELAMTRLSLPESLLEALRGWGAVGVRVSDAEMVAAGLELASLEGILPAPEGAACIAAVRKLLEAGRLVAGQRVVVVNPGCGTKRWEVYARRLAVREGGEADKLGGLITPR